MDPKNYLQAISAAALLALAAAPSPVLAQPVTGYLLADGSVGVSDRLGAGDQLLLEAASTALPFAGQTVELDGFSGVLGYSAETAYVLVIDGRASIGSRRARSGEILVIPPLGAQPETASYDAERFAQAWSADTAARHAGTHQNLRRLASRQSSALFFGRLGRTALNLAAPTGAQMESARRSVVGDPAVMAIRYSAGDDYAAIGRSVSERMIAALAAGDTASVAALLDPVPYGNTDLTGGGGDARRLTAASLIARHDWPRLLRGAALAPGADPGVWTAASPAARAHINLRRMGDFVFVSSIDLGDAS